MPSKPDMPCTSCGKLLWRSRTAAEFPRCRDCRKRERCGTANGYNKGCRCTRCREAIRLHMARYAERVKARDGVSPTAALKRRQKGQPAKSRICIGCGEPVSQSRHDAAGRPCHKKCRHLVPDWRRRGDESPKVRAFRKRIAAAAEGTTGGKRVWVQGPCFWCGAPFLAAGGAYCSDSCKASARKHRYLSERGRFSVVPAVRAAIYARDGWTCQLCFKPVLQGLSALDNGAPTLDHKIPQSQGGSHDPENLHLAHRWCNSMRRDLDLKEARCLLRS